MSVQVRVRNESHHKKLVRADALQRHAGRICRAEGLREALEISVLLCDDTRIRELNRTYRATDRATDVLSFEQDCPEGIEPRPLGDLQCLIPDFLSALAH